jgi:hypothetical protein
MAETGEIRPETLIRKGNRNASASMRRSFGWEEARHIGFLAEGFAANRGGTSQQADGDAALSEFIPNFNAVEYDEDSMEVFRRIVNAIARLRALPASGRVEESRPFSLNLERCDWDTRSLSVLSQIERSVACTAFSHESRRIQPNCVGISPESVDRRISP